MNIASLEGKWNCSDGGTYSIYKVGDKLVFHGEKHNKNGSYENIGIAEYDESSGTIIVTWNDTQNSKGDSKAKEVQKTTIFVEDENTLKNSGNNASFPHYGNLTREK